jgi:hypothetical protein
VKAFNDATAPWDMDSFYMNAHRYRAPVNITNGAANGRATTPGGTWASIAAKEADNKWIKYRPSDGLKRTVSEEVVPDTPVENISSMRVVWISAWGAGRPLAEVTHYLTQGAVFSMVYVPDNDAVCVIFQHASSAKALITDDSYHRDMKGVSMFGAKCSLIPGLPYEENDDLRRMGNPINERRRLTFARSQLFAHGMTKQRFEDDIFRIVGKQNVELVWLFNSGNGECPPSVSSW